MRKSIGHMDHAGRRRVVATAVAIAVAGLFAVTAPDPAPAGSTGTPFLEAGWGVEGSVASASAQQEGSMHAVTHDLTGAASYWNAGFTGVGVDVALIDTGVAPVEGLTYPGKVINGPDLSFESQAEHLRYLDTYGHGTHLAGIIAGRDTAVTSVAGAGGEHFVGMAPGARLLSLKVGDAAGTVDVSQVIAAIDWVVEHRNDNGMNIRVLNLAYGTDGVQSYDVDPLAYAVERAWNAGIVVVVAAGNDGNASPLRNPATDPFVIAVGAADTGTPGTIDDDVAADFSNCGTSQRSVDLLAPGRSIVSLRNPGSAVDLDHPDAVVADRFFLGSGTSQAAAVVAGAAALVVDRDPGMSPDQVKTLLKSSARSLGTNTSSLCQGAGMLDLAAALTTNSPRMPQRHTPSDGTGSLDAARGSYHVELAGVALEGEQDIMGSPWTPWCTGSGKKLECTGTRWDGGEWNGAEWTGADWSGLSWSGLSWSGLSWSGLTWSGSSWSGLTWSTNTWNGLSWSGLTWSGLSWSGLSWSAAVWLGLSWKIRMTL